MDRWKVSICKHFLDEEIAQNVFEYVLIVAVISLGIVIIYSFILSSSIQIVLLSAAQRLGSLF